MIPALSFEICLLAAKFERIFLDAKDHARTFPEVKRAM